jgi:hypothetical protein
MLDGLSEGLSAAVADAVREGVGGAVKEAVQAVLKEVLANPQIRAQLAPPMATLATPLEAAPRPTFLQRLRGWCQSVRNCVNALVSACWHSPELALHTVRSAWHEALALPRRAAYLWPFKYHLLIALGVGALAGVSGWYAEPWIAAALSGIGGFAMTLAVQAGLWVRRMFTVNRQMIT